MIKEAILEKMLLTPIFAKEIPDFRVRSSMIMFHSNRRN